MKVAVLSIATGRYVDFLEKWKRTVRQHFLAGSDLCMFVFTDAQLTAESDVVPVAITQLPWPLTSLFKFRYFRSIAPRLAEFDLIVHIDMDMYVAAAVREDEVLAPGLPLFAVRHPYWRGDPADFMERNPKSLAYIAPRMRGPEYWQGCFWGGRAGQVLRLVEECDAASEKDLNRHIIARWYDESHLNRYFSEHHALVHTLAPSFAYPEGSGAPYDAKIVHVAKDDRAYQAFLAPRDEHRFRWLGAMREPLRRAKEWFAAL